MARPLEKLVLRTAHRARTNWFLGQKRLVTRLAGKEGLPPELVARLPSRKAMLADRDELLARDLANIEEGRYLPPEELVPNPIRAVSDAVRYLADLPAVVARRKAKGHDEVYRDPPPGQYPRYYLQNFHYQTDGYLSVRSAALYDHQVEVLFNGAASAMRRQALLPLAEALNGKARGARLVDLGCGTGRFLREVKANHPRLAVTGVDLSPFYLAEARKNLTAWSGVDLMQGAAEATDLPDAAADVVTAIFLLHELPPKVRQAVVRETARLLKPHGMAILVDSIQLGDEPAYDALMDYFPLSFHEPYYPGYAREDLVALFSEAGLTVQGSDRAYLSKVMWFRKE